MPRNKYTIDNTHVLSFGGYKHAQGKGWSKNIHLYDVKSKRSKLTKLEMPEELMYPRCIVMGPTLHIFGINKHFSIPLETLIAKLESTGKIPFNLLKPLEDSIHLKHALTLARDACQASVEETAKGKKTIEGLTKQNGDLSTKLAALGNQVSLWQNVEFIEPNSLFFAIKSLNNKL